jgi:uncharacterized protein (TIGR03435 family)
MTARSIVIASLVAVAALAQSVTFEVSTIRPASPDANGRSFRFVGARRFTANNHTLNEDIGFAYNLTPALISGGPAWADTERYDIVGETPGETRPPNDQVMLMFKALLADRFKLKFHRGQKELSVYNLVVGKNPLKLQEAAGGDPGLLIQRSSRGTAMLPARNATMAGFASLMQRVVLDRPVVDKTGLTGKYDFDLEWSTDGTRIGSVDSGSPESAPDIFTAIQKFGLKLEATKAMVEVFIIDSAEKPDGN